MGSGAVPVVRVLARRPDLWITAARVSRSLVGRQWWRRPPYLPVPDRGWLHFRLITAYGNDGSGPMRPADVVAWLEWCRRFPDH